MINLITIDGSGRKVARPVTQREDYLAQRNAPENVRNFQAARGGDKKAKARQVQYNYNDLLPDGVLKGCHHVASTFAHDIDCQSAEEQERIKQVLLGKKEEIGLLELSGSANYGLHAVCRRERGKTILENQVRLSMLTETEMDTSTHDEQRILYTGPATPDNLFYLDDAIFEEQLSTEEAAEEFERLRERERQGQEEVPPGAKKANKHYRPWKERAAREGAPHSAPEGATNASSADTNAIEAPSGAVGGASYNGIPFKDIIAKYWELFNDGKEPVEGDRNVLTFELAVTLRSICGYSLEKMLQVIPNYWDPASSEKQGEEQDERRKEPAAGAESAAWEEWRKTIENALKEPRKGMPYRLRQVLQALKANAGVKACGGTLTSPPPMPKRLPPLIRLLTKNVPAFYKPAVAAAVFPALGAHLHGVKFRYWDNVEHEATFMNVLIGRQSIGKGTIKKPIEFIMEDIRQRDIPNRQREAEWKQKNPNAKQKKDPRPTDICIQMLIDNLTDAVFNQRIVDAHNNGERYIYTIVDEIDGLKKVTSRGTTEEVGLLIRKAFDNSLAGQERVGADSVSGIAPLRWNFNASATPPNARRFFSRMVNDGTVSRLDISTIIRPDDDDTAPVLGIYDNAFAQELKPYIERLEAANGLIECPQARKLALEMKEENRDAARLYDSEAYRVLSYRANVIAWLKGMVLYVAQGYRWDKAIADFVRWSERYNLWCKMLYFGQQLETELREEVEIQRQSGPQNLLELLPDEFTREQYRQMRASQGRTGDGSNTLRSWANRGYIVFDETSGRYCKTEKYKAKYSSHR